MRFITIIGFVVIITLVQCPVLADIFVQVDKEGVMHFTNTPTRGGYRVFIREKTRRYHARRARTNVDSTRYDTLIRECSQRHGVDFALVKAIIRAESDFDPEAISPKGAQGLMQLMPETAKKLSVFDPFNPKDNIEGGVKYLKYLLKRFDHNLPLSLAAYNAGETTVSQSGAVPGYPETTDYVTKVLQYHHEYQMRSLQGKAAQ